MFDSDFGGACYLAYFKMHK